MSAETYTVAVAVKEVAYHGSRRNALGDIFEHVDLTVVFNAGYCHGRFSNICVCSNREEVNS